MMASLMVEESANVVGVEEAATAAESDWEEAEDVSDTEWTAVVGMSLGERQLILREREMNGDRPGCWKSRKSWSRRGDYVENRKVGNSYGKLLELIVYNRIKASLPTFCHGMCLFSSQAVLR